MKKILFLLTLLCFAVVAKATVTINGKTLTRGKTYYNSDNIGISSGSISLSSGGMLTLRNVTLVYFSPITIDNGESIYVEGYCTIKASTNVTKAMTPIMSTSTSSSLGLEISGESGSTLKVNVPSKTTTTLPAITCKGGYLSVDQITLTTTSTIKGGGSTKLNVFDSHLEAENISGFGSIDLGSNSEGATCFIKTPTKGVFKNGSIYDADGNKATKIVIAQIENLFKIYGNVVTNANYMDIDDLASYDKEGNELCSLSYDINTKTLTAAVLGGNFEKHPSPTIDEIFLYNENVDGLTVKFENATDNSSVYIYGCRIISRKSFTIVGDGRDKTTFDIGDTRIITNENLCLKDINISSSFNFYLLGLGTRAGTLTIDHSRLSNLKYDAIRGFTDVVYTGGICQTTPEDLSYSTTEKQFIKDDEIPEDYYSIYIYDTYPLTIAGTAVNETNCFNVLGDGTVSYNPTKKALTLKNANISTTLDIPVIQSDVEDGLSVYLVGDNVLSSPASSTISSSTPLSIINGSSPNKNHKHTTLTLNGQSGLGRIDCASSLSLKEILLKANEIACSNPKSSVYVYTAGIENSKISGFKDINFSYAGILSPNGSSYDTSALTTVNADGDATSVRIVPYTLTICNTLVTTENASDILGDGTNISYDFEKEELILPGLNLDRSMFYFISAVQDLNIKVIGENVINTTYDQDYSALIHLVDGNLNIYGEGSLTMNGFSTGINNPYSVYTWDENSVANTVISDIDLTINTKNMAISSYGLELNSVNAHLKIEEPFSWNNYMVASPHVELVGCEVVQPYGCGDEVWTDQKVKEIIISQNASYGITVAGIEVTQANASDVLRNSSVVYDPEENILYLSQVNIDTSADNAIYNTVKNLVINVDGECVLNSADTGIVSTDDFKIEGNTKYNGYGPSILKVNAAYGYPCGISTDYDLTITNCSVEASSIEKSSANNYMANLFFEYSDFKGYGINGFSRLILNGGYIESPADAYYDTAEKTMYPVIDGEDSYYVICKSPLTIEDVQVTTTNAEDILGDGTASYDYSSKTLKLRNADVSNITSYAPLTVNLKGKNYIHGDKDGIATQYAIKSDKYALLINGSGYLKVYNSSGIYAPDGVTFEDTNVDIEVLSSGVYAWENKWFVINSNVNLTKDRDNGTLADAKQGLTLLNAHIAGADYDEVNELIKQHKFTSRELHIIADNVAGDANGDGHVTIADVVLFIEYINGKVPESDIHCDLDVSTDKRVDQSDVESIKRILLEMEDE